MDADGIVVLAKLKAQANDMGGYIIYVFEVLDEDYKKLTKYVMCTRFPNWEHEPIKNGDVGYLDYKELKAGTTQWYDGTQFHYHNYSNNQFNRFIKVQEDTNYDFTM